MQTVCFASLMDTVTQDTLFDLMQPASWHGRYFKTKCPFHDDREPSFLVYDNGGQCLSLSCRKRASLKQIHDHLTSNSRTGQAPTRTFYVDWMGMPDIPDVANRAHDMLMQNDETLGHYLKTRNIHFAIRQARLGWWLGWYTFPVFNEAHHITGIMLRASPAMQNETKQRWLAPPGQSTLLYSPDWSKIRHAPRIYLVFGIVDALVLWKLGFPVISPTFLKGLRAEMLDSIRKHIFIVPDYGEMAYARDLQSRLGWRGNIIDIAYPYTCKDPAEMSAKGFDNDLTIALMQP